MESILAGGIYSRGRNLFHRVESIHLFQGLETIP